MKSEINFDVDGWLSIALEAETPVEAGRLVQLALNAPADTRDKLTVSADQNGVRAWINLQTMRSRSFENRNYMVSTVPQVR